MNNFDRMRERLLFAAGVHEPASTIWQMIRSEPKLCNVANILSEGQWSPQFEKLQRNRLMMGAYRYGFMNQQRARGCPFNVVEPVGKKLKAYEETGNTEYLVDAANYLILVFELDPHPTKHFHALDDHSDHCKRKA